MCYHSNKLNVHYLHYIGSQGLQITSGRGKKETHHHMDHFQTTLLRFYHTEASPHTSTSALPGRSVEDRQDRGSWHTCEGAGRGVDPSKRKCHNIKDDGISIPVFRPNSLSPGMVRHRTEPLPQQPLTRRGSTVLGLSRACLLPPKEAHG